MFLGTTITLDNASLYPRQLRFWNDINTAWLSLFQEQKDTMESSLKTRTCLPSTYLNETQLENAGKFIITWCDILEEYGLVDYELGIWEEEILSGKWKGGRDIPW